MNDPVGVLLLLSPLLLLATAALYVWTALALSALFRKTGTEPWQAWVPVYNVVVTLRLGGYSGWWIVLAFVPVAQIVYYVVWILACHRVGRDFGFGTPMTVLGALAFPIWASIIGWGVARYLRAPDAATRGAAVRGGVGMQASVASATGPAADRPPVPAPPRPFAAPPLAGRAVPGGALPGGALPGGALPGGGVPGDPLTGGEPAAAALPRVVPPAAAGPVAAAPTAVPAPPAAAPVADTPEWAPPRPRDPAAAPPPAKPLVGALRRQELPPDLESEFLGRAPFTQTTPTLGGTVPLPPPPAPPITAVPGGDAKTPAIAWAPPHSDTDAQSDTDPQSDMDARSDSDARFDTSAGVSAQTGAPTAGAPRAARASVSAQHAAPEIPDDATFDETVIASRRRTAWILIPPLGVPIPLTGDVAILGRRPGPDPDFPQAQIVAIADETRTVSKTHARLELGDGEWAITDLASTNGVILIAPDGDETDAAPGVAVPVSERFLLGDAELQLRRGSE